MAADIDSTVTSPLGGRDRQREETRKRVYEAALTIFRRDGVVQARIDDIVKLAGVSRGTFYFHFPTKDDVLAELLHESERRVAAAVTALPEATLLADVLQEVGRVIANEWQADPKIFPDVGMVALKLTAVGVTNSKNDPVRSALAPHFRASASRGELNATLPPELVSDFYLVNAFGAALAWSGNPMVPLETVLQAVTSLFLNGATSRS